MMVLGAGWDLGCRHNDTRTGDEHDIHPGMDFDYNERVHAKRFQQTTSCGGEVKSEKYNSQTADSRSSGRFSCLFTAYFLWGKVG